MRYMDGAVSGALARAEADERGRGTVETLVPVEECMVLHSSNDEKGIVKSTKEELVTVQWVDGTQSDVNFKLLTSGFPIGVFVQEVPRTGVRKSLGAGRVIESRMIGGRSQVLVEFLASGQRHWLPYENLKRIVDIEYRFLRGKLGKSDHAERMRMKTLAYAIEMWNENTGALSHLEIDPLPHQIHLVHHILSSGNFNWLIADDVGLGKTIEVGMLLSAMVARKLAKRVLIVTPAGLVNQWQEEMRYKFKLEDFRIFGKDFHIHESQDWKLYDRVIVSIDRLKREENLQPLLNSDDWDIIIFDEGHRLTRRQWHQKFEPSERYRLAAALRKKTESILLLSATPHQGKHDLFQGLLNLLRPELKHEITTLSLNPEILGQMIIRNNKSEVTDLENQLIFKGKVTRNFPVTISSDEKKLDLALQDYIKEGYKASKTAKGKLGDAIGFVMSTYRKIAASSIPAIEASLKRRLENITRSKALSSDEETSSAISGEDTDLLDMRFEGENLELKLFGEEAYSRQFFEGEVEKLEAVLELAQNLRDKDSKIKNLTDDLLPQILKDNPKEKVLIFTEYKATQKHIADKIRKDFGKESVSLINGGMRYEEREDHIRHFEEEGQFLISTEAGGEGINLHRKCHIMINFDLPWNPMRLVQRVGRLYRYGQKKKVVVFNLHSPQTFDSKILDVLYDRIDSVVRDLASISEEYKDGLESEILGEISELVDVEDILKNAIDQSLNRTEEQIDEALRKAREAAEKQRDLLQYVAGFDANEFENEFKIHYPSHVQAFIEGMCGVLDIEIVRKSSNELIWDLKLPESLVKEFNFSKQNFRIAFSREAAEMKKDVEVIDITSALFQQLINKAQSYSFDGIVAATRHRKSTAIATAVVRWQNDHGKRMKQEFSTLEINPDDSVDFNSHNFAQWLLTPKESLKVDADIEKGKKIIEATKQRLNDRLSEVSNRHLHPENIELVSMAWTE